MPGVDPKDIEWLTASQIAKVYGVRPMAVHLWVEQGCPHMKSKDFQPLFRLKAVIAWRRRTGI